MLQIGCVILLILLMTCTVNLVISQKRSIKQSALLFAVFLVYAAGNLYFTIFSRQIGSGVILEFRPLQIYTHLFEKSVDAGDTAIGFASKFLNATPPIVGLILNILLYYPLGYLLPILFPKLKPRYVILIGCLCSIATEATQYLFKMGWCETDDVIHNTLGTSIGVWVWHLQSKRLNKQKSNELPKE